MKTEHTNMKENSPTVQLDQECNATAFTTATPPKAQHTLLPIIADSANIGVHYIVTLQPHVLYRATCTLFIDLKLQYKREKNDIS